MTDQEISIDKYCVALKDRNRNGGGVCTYIRNDVAFCIKNDISADQGEILWLELHLHKTKPIIIGTCYRPPKQDNFLEEFENNLCKLRSDCAIIILGDFNICLQQKSSSLFKGYSNLLRMFGLKQILEEPTRITCTSKSLIDHICVTMRKKNVQSGVILIGLSDPFLTFCTRKVVRGTFSKHKTVKSDL